MLTSARSQAGCAVCHERLDPPGMALERFDALGHERPGSTGTLTPLKLSLLGRKDEIVRTVVEKMLAFALGRPIEPVDQSTVKEICDKLASSDYRSSVLVLEIAKSFPFNYRRPAED
jgi:hypothetical protein